MTRNRANPDGTPGELAAKYYGQRASLGLVITEGTQPSADGQGYLNTPGIYTPEHIGGLAEDRRRGARRRRSPVHPADACRPDVAPG